MADAMKPLRQDVDQEAADELVGRQRHRLVSVTFLDPVVLPLERHSFVIS